MTYFYQGLLKMLGQNSAIGYTQLLAGAAVVMVVFLIVACVFSSRILRREPA
jgi:ABC-type glycerol-3-phosphate transport system permease component